MSSLRLALKQSLEDVNPPPQRKKTQKKAQRIYTGRPRGRPPKRKPGDPPRKRGRPRKHPLPEEEEETVHEEEEEHEEGEEEDDASSSEAEFSVSQEDDSDTDHEFHKEEEEEQEEEESSEDEEEMRRKRRKMQKKAMKRQRNSAANKIQNHWKKKRKPSTDETEAASDKKKKAQDDDQEADEKPKEELKKQKAKFVPAPDPDLVTYMRGLSVKKQKRNMTAGLRVKVRFATKVRKRDGKVATKLKWYGGLVTRVSTGGSKIRIKYDDGTSEVSKFPDKDVIVDETGNGEHRVSAGRFIPPAQRAAAAAATAQPTEEQSREDDVNEKKPTTPKKAKRSSSRAEKEDGQETAEAEPAENESPPLAPPAKSPKKAKKGTISSPKRRGDDDANATLADDEMEDSQSESDSKTGETQEAVADDTDEDVHNESSGSRKKLSLKIRLKGPKANIVPSDASRDSADNRSEEEKEEAHGGDESNEKEATEVDDDTNEKGDAMEVDEETNEQRTVGSANEEDRGEATPKSPEEPAAEESSDRSFGRKKRAHDKVTSDEAVEEPPRKKRQEKPVSENEPSEKEAKKDEPDEPEKIETTQAVGEDAVADDEKAADAAAESAEVEPERKRKRVEEEKEETVKPSSPCEPADSSALTPTSGETEPRAVTEDAMQVDSCERVPSESDAKPVDTKDSAAGDNDAASEEVPPEKTRDESDIARAKTPPPPAQEDEAKADDNAIKPVPAASIPRFGRRAAQQANERIAARKERIIEDEFAKKKKQRKEKAELKLLSPSERKGKRGDDDSDDEIDGEWVQCDNCSKWRILPSTVETSDLPKHWYCEMNVYDPDRSTCDAPEQTSQEILKEKRRRKKRLAKIARLEAAGKIDAETAAAQRLALDNKARKPSRGRGRPPRSPNPLRDSQDTVSETGRGRGRKKRSSPSLDEEVDQGADSPTPDAGDSQKSRSFKKQSSFGSTGRRSSSKSEVDDEAETEVEAEPVPKKRGRGRPPGRPPRARANKEGSKEIKGGKNGASDPDNQEWVACEKCQKWRRLPSHISADSLPDVWYCSMNTWDPNSATCDAAEDKADPGHQEFGIYGSGVSTASYGNKLSYRNLIFGTGRKQNRPITERTRAAESLFLAPTDPSSDSVSYPKVMYANSSVFMPRLSNAQKANAPDVEKKLSLFELMNHSNLWAELRAASNMAQPDKLGSSVVNASYDSLSDDLKQTMKEMVLHAIGSGTLACDEVLLEAQCRKWTNVPETWAELRASCTIDKIEGALRDLVANGSVETVVVEGSGGPITLKYRRTASVSAPVQTEVKSTRCMKLAKPWKKARPNMTREWASA